MAVSDDSKLKLNDIQYDIVLSSLKQIEDENLKKLLSLAQLKSDRPIVFSMMTKYRPDLTKCDIEYELVTNELLVILRDKCRTLLELMLGHDVDKNNDHELHQKLKESVDKLVLELNQVECVRNQIDIKQEKFKMIHAEYLKLKRKYLENFKIPFKSVYDETNCNMLLNKAHAIIMRKRLEDTEQVVRKYGNSQTIDKLKTRRTQLEKEEKALKLKLNESQRLVDEYNKLDPQLIREFKRLKSELETRRWAVNELNKSSTSDDLKSPTQT